MAKKLYTIFYLTRLSSKNLRKFFHFYLNLPLCNRLAARTDYLPFPSLFWQCHTTITRVVASSVSNNHCSFCWCSFDFIKPTKKLRIYSSLILQSNLDLNACETAATKTMTASSNMVWGFDRVIWFLSRAHKSKKF